MNNGANIIPSGSPWYFRLGYQGYLARLKYRRLRKIFHDCKDIHEDDERVEDAHDKLLSAQFACKYGRKGDEDFRKLISDMELQNIASREELMTLVMGRDLYSTEQAKVEVKLPIFSAIAGVIFMAFTLLAILAFCIMIGLSALSISFKLFFLLLFIVAFVACGYSFYLYSIYPYLLAKRLRSKLLSFVSERHQSKQPSLVLIDTRHT